MLSLIGFSSASGVPDEPVIFYRGCFRNISSKVVAPLDSFQACWKKCHREQYALTGIKVNILNLLLSFVLTSIFTFLL